MSSIPKTCPQSSNVAGWSEAAAAFKHDANFWHRVWIEAGWPSVGLLFNIKMNSKKRFKYRVKRLKCHQLYIARPAALASSKVRDF